MSPLERHEPLELARFSAMYAVVGCDGEPAGVAMWFNAGERLPLITVADVEPPLWYVMVGASTIVPEMA
jgi:hypothetical protein